MNQKISLMVVDDHEFIHAGFESYAAQQTHDLEVIAYAADGDTALQRYASKHPDVVLVDIDLDNVMMNGIDTIKALRKVDPGARIVVLSSWEDNQTIQDALKAGADGYMLKRSNTLEEVANAVRDVNAGYRKLSPQAALNANHKSYTSVHKLTRREREVLSLMVKGWSNRRIAGEFGISNYTVGKHVSSIISKLGVSNRAEAIVLALRKNLHQL